MNKKFTSFAIAMFSTFALNAQQVISDDVSLGESNDVFYNLSNQGKTTYDRNSWDLSFYVKDSRSAVIRVNDALGTKVYEASNNISDWNNIDITNINSWNELYNSDTTWNNGAFSNGSAQYGWGEYNMANHVVYGSVIFVLKYSDNSYIKLKINNLTYGIYNLTYSEWDASNKVWLDDVTRSVDSSSSSNTNFIYYSFINDEKVTSEPAKDEWDLKFTKYTTPIQAGPQIVPYTVTGVLQSDLIKVAKTETGNPASDNDYSSDINSIGYNWKIGSGNYTMVQRNHFIKNTSTNKIYKLIFKSYQGGSVAKTTFEYEDVTSIIGKTKCTLFQNEMYNKIAKLIPNIKAV